MPSIDNISAIGPKEARALRKSGIRSTTVLLERAATRKGRRQLAEETGLSEADLIKWAQLADLLRVQDVGAVYLELLARLDIHTIDDLRQQNPEVLWALMRQVNERRYVVRRLPSEEIAKEWVANAFAIQPMVKL